MTCGEAVAARPVAPVAAGPAPAAFAPAPPAAGAWAPANDPHGVGLAASRLSQAARRGGRAALLVATAYLEEGERVEALVQGRVMGAPGVVLLTAHRVLAVNEAEWKPMVLSVRLEPGVSIQGWEDDRSATLLLQTATGSTTIDLIRDRLLARELAHRLRTLALHAPAPAAPAVAAPAPAAAAAEDGVPSDGTEQGAAPETTF